MAEKVHAQILKIQQRLGQTLRKFKNGERYPQELNYQSIL